MLGIQMLASVGLSSAKLTTKGLSCMDASGCRITLALQDAASRPAAVGTTAAAQVSNHSGSGA
jgi:hypothetical protein